MAKLLPEIKIFVSSPGDVNEERIIAERVLTRLAEGFKDRLRLTPIFWEHEPMVMTQGFQTQIPLPSEVDIFIGILWSRLGTRLPQNITRENGSYYSSGTEFEFENAWAAFREKGQPEIFIYRKMAKPYFDPDLPDLVERLEQKHSLDAFYQKWFMDENGSFTAAFNPFDNLAQFEERLEEHLRKVLFRRFPSLDIDSHVRAITWSQGSPFCGLESFDVQRTSVFFGRTRAISEVIAILRRKALESKAFCLLIGMSGIGKSSLLHAGILPLLTQAGVIENAAIWQQANFKPSTLGRHVFQGFAHTLLAPQGLDDLSQIDALTQALETSNAAQIQQIIHQRLTHLAKAANFATQQMYLLLTIDQLEEIFTQEAFSHNIRSRFIDNLAILAQCPQVWILCALRSDFYSRCGEMPNLTRLLDNGGQYLLSAPEISEISQMIRLPAYAAGLQFERHPKTDHPLDATLLDAMHQHPEALPLLGFCLDILYQKRDKQGYLTHAAYQQMGGLEGALAQSAENIYNGLSLTAQATFAALMRTLVTVSQIGDTPISGRRMIYEGDPLSTGMQSLLDAFVAARLITLDQTEQGIAYARLVHEALLHHWPRLQIWIQEERHLLRIRARLRSSALAWETDQHNCDLLISEGKPLIQAEDLLKQWQNALDNTTRDYIKTSLAQSEQRQAVKKRLAQNRLRNSRRLSGVFAILCIFAMIGGYYGYKGQRIAEQKTLDVQNTQSRFFINLAQQHTQNSETSEAIQLALKALPTVKNAFSRPYLAAAEEALYSAVLQHRERQILQGHQAAVVDTLFTPDSQKMVSISNDHTAKLWSVATGELLTQFIGHEDYIVSVAISHDGRWLATGSWDDTARLWDIKTGQLRWTLQEHNSPVIHVEFSPDASHLLTVSDDAVRLWTMPNGTLDKTLAGHKNSISSAHFSPDGQWVLTTSWDATARLWQVSDGALHAVLTGHQAQVLNGAFSPDSQIVATVSSDKTARLWQVKNGHLLKTLTGHTASVTDIQFSPGNTRILTTSDQQAHVWDMQGQLLHTLRGHNGEVFMGEFSPDGQQILTVAEDTKIYLWNTLSGDLISTLAGHDEVIFHAHFSPDQNWISSASQDNTARLWQTHTDMQMRVLTGHDNVVNACVYSPDGSRLATASADHNARLWNTETGDTVGLLSGHGSSILSIAYSPDGQFIATGAADAQVVIWAVDTGKALHVLKGHTQTIREVNFSPDSQLLVSASDDHTVKVWDVATGSKVADLEGAIRGHKWQVTHAIFNPAGNRILTASSDGTARLWDYRSARFPKILRGHKGAIRALAIHPKGQRFATGGADGRILLWNSDGQLVANIKQHDKAISDLTFSPDGQWLASSAWDNSAKLWQAYSGEAVREFSGHTQAVKQVHFSPDSRRLLTTSDDLSLRVWQVDSGEMIAQLRGHQASINAACFAPNGKQIASVSNDKSVRLWRSFSNTQALQIFAQQLLPPTKKPIK